MNVQLMEGSGWQLLPEGGHPTETVAFMTTRLAVRIGNIVSAWLRREYKTYQRGSVPFQSEVMRYQFDCGNMAIKIVAYRAYTGQNLSGKVASNEKYNPDELAWAPVVPGTFAEGWLE